MSAADVLPWLALAMSSIAFLAGIYLLVRGKQAANADEDSEITALGFTIKSSTPGLAVTGLAIIALFATVTFGVIPAATEESGGGSDPTSEPSVDPTPEPSGLNRDTDLIQTQDLNERAGLIAPAWSRTDHPRGPVLDCQREPMPEQPGLRRPLALLDFRGSGLPGPAPMARTVAARFETPELARETFDRIVGWLEQCGEVALMNFARDVSVANAGDAQEFSSTGRQAYWRNYRSPATPAECTECEWIDSQGVGLAGDVVVVISLVWIHNPAEFASDEGPMADLLARALVLAI